MNRLLAGSRRLAPYFAALFALYFLIPLFWRPPFFFGADFFAWGSDWGSFSQCLAHEGAACARLSKFPAGYLLNSFFLGELKPIGLGPEQSLLVANTIFLMLPILFLLLARGLAYASVAGGLYLLALLGTPIPSFYVYSGALEIQSGVAIGIFLSSIALVFEGRIERPNFGFSAFFLGSALLFPWYKDTNIAVVLAGLFLALGLSRRRPPVELPRAFLLPAAAGVACSLALSFAYNWVKYQTVLPHAYLLERARASPSAARSLEFLAAGIFSPNGGTLIFWAFAVFVILAGARFSGLVFSRFSLLCAGIIGAGFLLANSLWWAPFGWDSWGDRLMIPAGLGSLILVLSAGTFSSGSAAGAPPRRRLSPALLLAALSFYYVSLSSFAEKETAFHRSLAGPACGRMMGAMRVTDPKPTMEFWRTDFYYDCA